MARFISSAVNICDAVVFMVIKLPLLEAIAVLLVVLVVFVPPISYLLVSSTSSQTVPRKGEDGNVGCCFTMLVRLFLVSSTNGFCNDEEEKADEDGSFGEILKLFGDILEDDLLFLFVSPSDNMAVISNEELLRSRSGCLPPWP